MAASALSHNLMVRTAATLLIATIAGWLAAQIGMPLAWMLGPMLVCAVLALYSAPLYLPQGLRTPMLAIIGTMLGASFTPDLLGRVAAWPLTLGAMLLYTPVAAAAGYLVLRQRGDYDKATAYFACLPGGLSEMIALAEAHEADMRSVAVVHSVRVLLLVLAVPLVFTLFGGVDQPDRPAPPGLADLPLGESAVLIGCALAGWWLGERLNLPARGLTGGLIVSSAAHISGISTAAPPAEILTIALVIVGAGIGTRFVDKSLREIRDNAIDALLIVLVMLALAGLFALVLAPLSGVPVAVLLLAYIPGGIGEMSLLAVALGMESAFVALHHVTRLIIVLFATPVAYRWLGLQRCGELTPSDE